MNKKAQNVTILSVALAFVLFLGLFGSLTLITNEVFTDNNITMTGNYASTQEEITNITNKLKAETVDDFDDTTQQAINVSGGSSTAEENQNKISLRYVGTIFTYIPKIVGLTSTTMADLGVNPFVISILLIAVMSIFTYAFAVFLRRGF